eukprot:TRINITY_DN13944_c0_g1_i2.p1 TRINITY_DN13944_c0_g1~~TRINITY_DN13944_c0_g1_i2.p1  ORF type:complete len:339 (+),score=54.49 TRINITY_DN13944_c0_g1_i2:73-1089(+)
MAVAAPDAEAETTESPNGLEAFCKSIAACPLCVLRVRGERDPARYAVSDDTGGGSQTTSCGLCLGMLERRSVHLAALRRQLEAATLGQDGEEYKLSIQVPVLCQFRHLLLTLHLRSVDLSGDCVVDIKDALRWVVSQELTASGLQPDVVGVSGKTADLLDALQRAPPLAVAVSCDYDGPEVESMDCLRRDGSKRRGHQPAAKKQRLDNKDQQASGVSLGMVQEALAGASHEAASELLGVESLAAVLGRVEATASASFELQREGLYFKGRYIKLSRRLPQSPWIINGKPIGDGSVEEQFMLSNCLRERRNHTNARAACNWRPNLALACSSARPTSERAS